MRDSRGRRGAGLGDLIDRRTFLAAGVGLALWPITARAHGGHPWPHPAASDSAPLGLPDATVAALDGSDYVYVSPLLGNGEESRCHGEVWYGWFDGHVHLITSVETWKARALAKGLDGARIWVGNHGRWKQMIGRNEDFRAAPHFDAKARAVKDAALVERLLSVYDRKYPEEIGEWRDKMKTGTRDGTRVLIRYTPA